MDLIGHRHKDGKRKHKTVPGVGLRKGIYDREIHTGRGFKFYAKGKKNAVCFLIKCISRSVPARFQTDLHLVKLKTEATKLTHQQLYCNTMLKNAGLG